MILINAVGVDIDYLVYSYVLLLVWLYVFVSFTNTERKVNALYVATVIGIDQMLMLVLMLILILVLINDIEARTICRSYLQTLPAGRCVANFNFSRQPGPTRPQP